jgi:hypothetical protein
MLTHQVPISLGVIVISLSLAFMPWVRGAIYWISTVAWAVMSEYTGLRYIWLKIISYSDKESGRLRHHEIDAVFTSQRRTVSKITSRLERKKMKCQVEEAKRIEESQDVRERPSRSGPKNAGRRIEGVSVRFEGPGENGLGNGRSLSEIDIGKLV